MKLIHCADLHLDSKMTANLPEYKAQERKQEILNTFQRMIDYAQKIGAVAMIIAGDLFDTKNVSRTTQNIVYNEIQKHPNIQFFYLKGNHDLNNFLLDMEELPQNLKMFEDYWTTYELGNEIRITGIEFSQNNRGKIYETLKLDTSKINLVIMHGQEIKNGGREQDDMINLRALENRGIDYLALGHIHSYKKAVLDARGVYCYPGCLEGRGFDECGEHGFVLLEIDEEKKKIGSEFIPYAKRNLYEVFVNVNGVRNSLEIVERARRILVEKNYDKESLIKLVLEGELDVECEINLDYIKITLESEFYFLKVKNNTHFAINIEEYSRDLTLKGEFIRTVQSVKDLSYEDRNTIIRYGLQYLKGEEIRE